MSVLQIRRQDGISRLPGHSPVHPGCHPGSPASDTSAGRQQFYYGNVLPFFPASHPAGTSHSYAGMMRRLRDTLTQGKIGTALIGIKRPAGSTRHPLTHRPKFPAPEHGKATVPYAVPGQKAHRPACCVTARRHGTSGHTGIVDSSGSGVIYPYITGFPVIQRIQGVIKPFR